MDRIEYMKELELLLANIPSDERDDAISYYNDYFDAGGAENEEATIKALGTPEELAATIKLAGNQLDKYGTSTKQINTEYESKTPKKRSVGWIILFIICAVFAAPILLPVLFGLFMAAVAIAIAIIAVIFAVLLALVAAGIGVLISGITGLVVGIVTILSNPFGALVVIGLSCIGLALGVLFCMGVAKIIKITLPPIFNGCIKLIKSTAKWLWGKIKLALGRRSS